MAIVFVYRVRSHPETTVDTFQIIKQIVAAGAKIGILSRLEFENTFTRLHF